MSPFLFQYVDGLGQGHGIKAGPDAQNRTTAQDDVDGRLAGADFGIGNDSHGKESSTHRLC